MHIEPLHIAILSLLGLAFLMAFIRLVLGPSLADRVVAFDVMTTVGMGFIAVYAVSTENSIFLDVVTVVALVAFLAAIAIAYYMKRKV
jgi:multicomponent Na+:H+ antiporter subunit F